MKRVRERFLFSFIKKKKTEYMLLELLRHQLVIKMMKKEYI